MRVHVTSLSTLTRLAGGFGMKSTPTPRRPVAGKAYWESGHDGDSPQKIGSPVPLGGLYRTGEGIKRFKDGLIEFGKLYYKLVFLRKEPSFYWKIQISGGRIGRFVPPRRRFGPVGDPGDAGRRWQ